MLQIIYTLMTHSHIACASYLVIEIMCVVVNIKNPSKGHFPTIQHLCSQMRHTQPLHYNFPYAAQQLGSCLLFMRLESTFLSITQVITMFHLGCSQHQLSNLHGHIFMAHLALGGSTFPVLMFMSYSMACIPPLSFLVVSTLGNPLLYTYTEGPFAAM